MTEKRTLVQQFITDGNDADWNAWAAARRASRSKSSLHSKKTTTRNVQLSLFRLNPKSLGN